jgi:perosamine synthetase
MTELAVFGGKPIIESLKFNKWPIYSDEVSVIVSEKIKKGDFAGTNLDVDVAKFERNFAQRLCPDHYVSFCGSGTAGLHLAYLALALESGSEVLVPTNTFRATVTPLLHLNLAPVFCDATRQTGSIDLVDAEQKITSKTRAIVVTHMWGHPVDMRAATYLAKKYDLFLVEDCSHAHGVCYEGVPVGAFGDVGVFSVGTKKLVSGGIGGVVVTKSKEIFERVLAMGQPKPISEAAIKNERLKTFLGVGFGLNYRGSPISAILADEHLRRLDSTIAIKNENIKLLVEALNIFLPDLKPLTKDNYFTHGALYAFNCVWDNTSVPAFALFKALKAEGVRVNQPSEQLHRGKIFYESVLLPQRTCLSTNKKGEFIGSDYLFTNMIGWDTREFYDPASHIVEKYADAFQKVSLKLHELVELK